MIASLFWPVDATPKPFKDVRIDESVGIDFSAYPRTLMMVLHSECGYCHESVPFYRRVITRAVDLQVVVVASSDDVGSATTSTRLVSTRTRSCSWIVDSSRCRQRRL